MEPTKEFVKLWVPADTCGIELFSARLLKHTYAKHMHESYTIGINDGGQGAYAYRGETHTVYPGSLNLLNPGEVHTGGAVTDAGWAYRNLYVDVLLLQKVIGQTEWRGKGLPYFPKTAVWDEGVRKLVQRLFTAFEHPTSKLERDSLLLCTLSKLISNHADEHCELRPVGKELTAVEKVRNYLEAHYAADVSIDELAQLANLSPYYLIRTFHHSVGIPPHAYQRQIRVLRAKQALRTSRQSISEVALTNGFFDQSHFNRLFKRTFGITPGQYRHSLLSG
ncbi:AraC family transcriptional regulator [Leptolyngbya sp. FACHB-261]|uniref:AraC family transcriptional regulator n=1 Tax=Leptolyngbya sp. FACHB-261 TaxID=2692806 RepID=UPI0016855D67|nr:AraC family transcriptional regulator [Leptolyngbya sp. FACHB-261]MBD2103530.1 AraC family transcriptional regulator [Leptolyngbya sp. FACHB-261]